LHARDYQGTRGSHYYSYPKCRLQAEAGKNRFIRNIYAIDPSDATASQLPIKPVWRVFFAQQTCVVARCPAIFARYPWHVTNPGMGPQPSPRCEDSTPMDVRRHTAAY